ncbi:MAG: S8 family serine peptidase [Thermoanaerobaculia bacterium]|nr:S8 family serine peptidase [Thermoanaerobaculia bacterium]
MTVHAYPEARLVRIGDPGALAPAMRASITPIEETDRIDYRAWSGEYPHLSPEDLRGLPRALYLVSLAGPVDPDWLPRFEASGLSLLDHANPYSILVRGDGDGLRRATTVRTSAGFPVVKSVVPLPIEARLDATLLELASGRRRVEEIPGLLRTADGAAVVRALPFPDGDSESLLFQVGQHLAKVEPRLAHGYDDAFAARGPELPALLKDLEEIAHLEVVHERELHNNLAAKSYILNIEPVWSSLGYNGAGVIVGHNDSGVSLTHPDFPTGVVIATAGAMSGTNNEHGTHVAGSVVGRGLAAGSPTNTSGCGDVTPPLSTVRGMAWGASLVANNIFDGGYTTETSMMQWSYGQGARLSTNSWGYTNDYNYDSYAVSVDTLVRDAATTAGNQELAILFSAGNSGSGASTVGSPGTAKNALTVGASQNDRCGSYVPSQQSGPNINTITTFSSRGPSQGRIKPDVVAVGADVLSVDSLNCSGTPRDPCEEGWDQAWTGTYYRLMPGTSMSTPITAGASAVFFEFFNSTFGANPSPALTKAAMINGAVDIGVGYPSYSQGWGRINLRQSIEGPPGGRINFLEQSASRLLTTGTNFTKTFSVFSTSPRLKITLVWTDPRAPRVPPPPEKQPRSRRDRSLGHRLPGQPVHRRLVDAERQRQRHREQRGERVRPDAGDRAVERRGAGHQRRRESTESRRAGLGRGLFGRLCRLQPAACPLRPRCGRPQRQPDRPHLELRSGRRRLPDLPQHDGRGALLLPGHGDCPDAFLRRHLGRRRGHLLLRRPQLRQRRLSLRIGELERGFGDRHRRLRPAAALHGHLVGDAAGRLLGDALLGRRYRAVRRAGALHDLPAHRHPLHPRRLEPDRHRRHRHDLQRRQRLRRLDDLPLHRAGGRREQRRRGHQRHDRLGAARGWVFCRQPLPSIWSSDLRQLDCGLHGRLGDWVLHWVSGRLAGRQSLQPNPQRGERSPLWWSVW